MFCWIRLKIKAHLVIEIPKTQNSLLFDFTKNWKEFIMENEFQQGESFFETEQLSHCQELFT